MLACGLDDSMLRLNPTNLLYKYRWTSEHKYAVGVKLPVFKWEKKKMISPENISLQYYII